MTPEERAKKAAQLAEQSAQFAAQSPRDREITAMFVTLVEQIGLPISAESIAAAVTSGLLAEERAVRPGGFGDVTFPGDASNLPYEKSALAQGGLGGTRKMVHQTSGRVPQGNWQVIRPDAEGKNQ